MPCATLVSTGFFMLIPLHCQVKEKKDLAAKQSIKHIKTI